MLWHRCFPVNFAKFLRTPFLTEHLRWLLLHLGETAYFVYKLQNFNNWIQQKTISQVFFKHFIQGLEVAIRRRSFTQNPWQLFVKKLICNKVVKCQTYKFTKKTLWHILLHVFCLHFYRMHHDYFFRRGFESVRAQFLSGNISEKLCYL